MSRFLMMSVSERGLVNPRVGIARKLREAGHHVSWLCLTPDREGQVAALALDEVLALPPPSGKGLSAGREATENYADPEGVRRFCRIGLVESQEALVAPIRAAIAAARPDVALVDPLFYATGIAAHEAGVPSLAVSTNLTLLQPAWFDSDMIRAINAVAAERAALFARHGMAPTFRGVNAVSPHANVVFTTRALVGDDASPPPKTFLVGPSLADDRGDERPFPWERLDGRPLVYVAFGSRFYWQRALAETFAAACAALDAQLVLAVGELADDAAWIGGLSGRPVVVRYAPQRALIARARVAVNHGGHGSVMETLWEGVPQLVTPLFVDQPLQAMFVEKAGVGLSRHPAGLGVDACRDALAALLPERGPFRDRAAAVAASYRATDGAADTARLAAALLDR